MVICGFILCGCENNYGAKTEAGKVVAQYLKAQTLEEKAQYILNPESELPLMRDFYAKEELNTKDITVIISEEEGDPFYSVTVRANNEEMGYALKKENGSFKIYWSWSMFIAGKKIAPNLISEITKEKSYKAEYQILAVIKIFPLWPDAGKTYVFEISDNNYGLLPAYCYKNENKCEQLFKLLAEKESCFVFLKAKYSKKELESLPRDRESARIEDVKVKFCI